MLFWKNWQRGGEHKPLYIDNIKYAEINNCAHSSRVWYLVMYYLWSSSNLYWVLQSLFSVHMETKVSVTIITFFGTSDNLICFQGWKNSSAMIISVGTVWSIYVICCKHLTYLWFKTLKIWGQCPIKKETLAQHEYRQIVYKSVSQKL